MCVRVCVFSEGGGKAAAPEAKQRAEKRVFSPGGAGERAQQHAQG